MPNARFTLCTAAEGLRLQQVDAGRVLCLGLCTSLAAAGNQSLVLESRPMLTATLSPQWLPAPSSDPHTPVADLFLTRGMPALLPHSS